MENRTYILSRSSFAKGLQCSKLLFLVKNKQFKEEEKNITYEQIAIKKRTTYLRQLAQKLYPKGTDALQGCQTYEQSAEKTEKLIQAKFKVIYNAVFIQDEIAIVVDILVYRTGRWKAYEIKGGTKVSKGSYLFAAFKWHVLKNASIFIHDFVFILLDKEYVRGDKLQLMQCFTRVPALVSIRKLMPSVEKKITEFKAIIQQENMPIVDIGKHCLVPHDCRMKSFCWKNVPENSVLEIAGLNHEHKFKLYQEGIVAMEDVLATDEGLLNEHHEIQIKSLSSGNTFLKKEELKTFLKQISYPLYYLDFESYQPFLPREKGMSPLQQCVFQYSLHQQAQEKGELVHHEFLVTPHQKEDIRLLLLENLLKNTEKAATILIYDISFERYYLEYLATVYPKYQSKIQGLIAKMVDLMVPFSQKYVYTPEMKGLHSIKAVLPALIPEMDYKELNLQNGLMASLVYAQWCEETFDGEEAVLEKNLKEYCALDTFAMVKILTVLQNIANE